MTENEAIRDLQYLIEEYSAYPPETGVNATVGSLQYCISALKEIQQYREIGTIEEIRKMINQGINNCYMSHKYEHPGYEEGMCAGLRTMNGDGEPVYKCKLCRLNYLFERSEGE